MKAKHSNEHEKEDVKMENSKDLVPAISIPAIPRETLEAKSQYQIPLNMLTNYSGAFSVVAMELVKACKHQSFKGMYRCVFPDGVTGKLAKFKDGTGSLGTIMDDGKIVGQARWNPVDSSALPLAFDPVTLAVAGVMLKMDKKLDQIKETQEEILTFLRQDKESELEGAVNCLADILDHFRYNSDNEAWKSSQLTVATTIKGKAEHNIIFYRKEISDTFEKQDPIFTKQKLNQMLESVGMRFRYYQLCIYLYSYASFLEVVLNGNYSQEYLNHVTDKINDYALQYREDYTICYNQMEALSRSALESKVVGGIGTVSKKIGEKIASTRIISKGPLDEALLSVAEKSKRIGLQMTDRTLLEFADNKETGIQFFVGMIDEINRMSHRPVEMLFDRETVYLCV